MKTRKTTIQVSKTEQTGPVFRNFFKPLAPWEPIFKKIKGSGIQRNRRKKNMSVNTENKDNIVLLNLLLFYFSLLIRLLHICVYISCGKFSYRNQNDWKLWPDFTFWEFKKKTCISSLEEKNKRNMLINKFEPFRDFITRLKLPSLDCNEKFNIEPPFSSFRNRHNVSLTLSCWFANNCHRWTPHVNFLLCFQ